jgi:hypothetical protein
MRSEKAPIATSGAVRKIDGDLIVTDGIQSIA